MSNQKSKPMTTLRQVNQAIAERYPDVKMTRGRGYYYLCSDNQEVAWKLAGLPSTSICIYSVRDVSIEAIMEMVDQVMKREG
jgi:hypothetical protein